MEPSFWKRKKVIILSLLIGLLSCILFVLIFLVLYRQETEMSAVPQTPNKEIPTLSAQVSSTTDYNLFIKQDIYEQEANWFPEIWYQDLGIVEYGAHAGWKRVLGFRSANDPSGGYQNLFITNDGKTFLVDDPYFREGGPSYYNKDVVIGTTTVPHPFPEQFSFGGVTLVRESFITRDESLAMKGGIITKQGDFEFSEEKLDDWYISTSTESFLRANTNVFVENKEGNTVRYRAVTSSSYRKAMEKMGSSERNLWDAWFNFQKELDYDQELSTLLMPSYASYFQGGCSQSGAILNSQFESDLRQIGIAKTGEPVYLFKEKDHVLVKAFYDRKIKRAYDSYLAKQPWTLYTSDGKDTIPPSFEQYKDTNPVIVIKDNLGRYIVLGEYYFGLADGCGKPVIYLYPEKPTKVTLAFTKFLSFALDIPKYVNGWKVLAYPDGTLNDLQKDLTPCHLIDSSQHGSEYAAEACKKNQYPYIYWEGVTVGGYPGQKKGWVVRREELEKIMDEKLGALSLSDKERADMLSFWVPEMKKKNSPYYRISFIQTEEMNNFVPMRVNPKPDTTIRVFLDWEPLSESVSISPQELKGSARKGFVFVEWGGLKR